MDISGRRIEWLDLHKERFPCSNKFLSRWLFGFFFYSAWGGENLKLLLGNAGKLAKTLVEEPPWNE